MTIESLASPPPAIPPIEHESVKLFVLAGQSNMVGQYAYAAELPAELQGEQADVVVYNRGTWSTLHPGIGAASAAEFGPEVTFGRAMADAMSGHSVVLIKYAVGATTLAEDWNPNTPGPLYTGLVDAVNEAVAELSSEHDVEIAGMAWMQGESDAFDLGKSEAYEANLRDFIQSLRDDWAEPDLPFVIGEIASDPVWTHYDVVQQAEAAVAASTSNVTAFSTDDLPTTNHHYNTQGQILLGRRFADAMMTPGDANFDGYVDDRDASILGSHWQMREGATWADGDFNRDGMVTDADAAIMAAHWREAPPAENVSASEPAVAAMLAGAAVLLLLRQFAAGRRRVGQGLAGVAGPC
ncbi:MAG: dockerin type I domain-containing protein [Planctomycetia bacterium]|nr:dockerin type I domain-containing protein [Planctomycetia bacterium]